jgi:hypothetical protein
MNKDNKQNNNKRQISNINSPSSLSQSLQIVNPPPPTTNTNTTNTNTTTNIIGQPTATTTSSTLKSSKRLRKLLHEDYCFSCGCGGELIECDACPKVYHAECISSSGIIPSGTWICPWHYCETCNTSNVTITKEDGSGMKWSNDIPQALCAHCPLSYCMNGCWPLSMSERCFNPNDKVIKEALRRGLYIPQTCLLFVCDRCLLVTQDEGLDNIWNKNNKLEIKDNIVNRNRSIAKKQPVVAKAAIITTSITNIESNINISSSNSSSNNNLLVDNHIDLNSTISTITNKASTTNNNTKSITITSFGHNSKPNSSSNNSNNIVKSISNTSRFYNTSISNASVDVLTNPTNNPIINPTNNPIISNNPTLSVQKSLLVPDNSIDISSTTGLVTDNSIDISSITLSLTTL